MSTLIQITAGYGHILNAHMARPMGPRRNPIVIEPLEKSLAFFGLELNAVVDQDDRVIR